MVRVPDRVRVQARDSKAGDGGDGSKGQSSDGKDANHCKDSGGM